MAVHALSILYQGVVSGDNMCSPTWCGEPVNQTVICYIVLWSWLHSYNLTRQDGYIVISGPVQGEIDKQHFQGI